MECTDRTQRMWLERGEAIGRWLKSVIRRVASVERRQLAKGGARRGIRATHGPLLR